jgi:hypothetical protein
MKNTSKMKTMKSIYILAAFLGLNFGSSFAAGNFSVADFNYEAPAAEIRVATLAPVTPKEADFEDVSVISATTTPEILAPVTPAVADFEDHI